MIDDEAEFDGNAEYAVPIEAEQALKKISKRGNETRSKGFRELLSILGALLKEHLAAVALQLRSSFVSVFKKYSFEPDKNNRLALGRLLELFVSSADLKSFLAPILPDVLFLWLLAMYDPIKDVAIVYRKAFDTAFANAAAVEKLLTRFSEMIRNDFESYLHGKRWDSIRELTCVDLGGSEEEAAGVIELVQTELAGLSLLLVSKRIIELEGFIKYLIQDKTMSAPRRLALYRLYKSTKNDQMKNFVAKLLQSETNPASLSFLIELIPDLGKTSEITIKNYLENLPEEDFKRLADVAWSEKDVVVEAIIKFSLQTVLSKKRFTCIWTDFCGPILSQHASDAQIALLLFDEKRPFKAIGPLSPSGSIQLLTKSLPKERILRVASAQPNSCQKALLLSAVQEQEQLETCLASLSLEDLQRPELAGMVSKDTLQSALGNTNTCSLQEIINMLEKLEPSLAIEFISKHNNIEELVTFASVSLLRNVFLKPGLKLPITPKTVAAALESDISCFSEAEIDSYLLEEALSLCKPHWNSPLLKELVEAKRFSDVQNVANVNMLLDRLNITPELFLHLNLENEEYFSVEAFKTDIPCEIEIVSLLMYKSRSSADPILKQLSSFTLSKESNIKVVSLWAYLNGLSFTCESSIVPESNAWTDYSLLVSGVKTFGPKSPLFLYSQLRTASVSEVNTRFDELLFPESDEESSAEILKLTAAVEPLLPIKSDKLAALLDRCTKAEALLLISRHINRSDLSREFWQVQWQERIKPIISEASSPLEEELVFRVLAGLWNVLESPEIEFLPLVKETLLAMPEVDTNLYFEQYGAARLFYLAIPFLEFNRDSLLSAFNATNCGPWLLAIRSALLMLVMDESLIATQTKLSSDTNLLEDIQLEQVFPRSFNCESTIKKLVTLELFVSWCEGGKEDSLLQSAFHQVFKNALLSQVVEPLLSQVNQSRDTFDFTPREFEDVELAEHLLYRLCAQFPLIMSSLFHKVDCIEKLATREIDRIRRCGQITAENVTIKLKPVLTSTTRVVNLNVNFAGDMDLEITLHMPANFPMEAIRVEGVKRSGLPESRWKSALLSLQAIFRSSAFNGNVVEAVRKWQANALKLFQGIEECAVCYSVVHPSDRSLPGPNCKQCKHRFHASCLYKWFKTSGNATCPLCRALF